MLQALQLYWPSHLRRSRTSLQPDLLVATSSRYAPTLTEGIAFQPTVPNEEDAPAFDAAVAHAAAMVLNRDTDTAQAADLNRKIFNTENRWKRQMNEFQYPC
jgi:hypothetical protein